MVGETISSLNHIIMSLKERSLIEVHIFRGNTDSQTAISSMVKNLSGTVEESNLVCMEGRMRQNYCSVPLKCIRDFVNDFVNDLTNHRIDYKIVKSFPKSLTKSQLQEYILMHGTVILLHSAFHSRVCESLLYAPVLMWQCSHQ